MPDDLAIQVAKLHVALVAEAVGGATLETQTVALRLAISDVVPFTLGMLAVPADPIPSPQPPAEPTREITAADEARLRLRHMPAHWDAVCAKRGIAPADLVGLPPHTLAEYVREVLPPRPDGKPHLIAAECLPGWAKLYADAKANEAVS